MSRLILRSPAKLNLFIKVLNKRPDGFHNIQTLFERIDLCDRIILRANRSGKINLFCDHPALRQIKSNLVYRAAYLLKHRCRVSQGVDIHLIKNIPVAAGLGGGSGNAATTLLGLNRLWSLGLSNKRLLMYGNQLGSDVPFFLTQTSWALGKGRGDIIRPLDLKRKVWHVLVAPRMKIYSREVFMSLNLQLTKKNDDVNILIHNLRNNNIYKIKQNFFNELEWGILKVCPRLAAVKRRISEMTRLPVSFSGSGPSLFCVTDSRKEALRISQKLKSHYSRVYLVGTM